MARPIAPTPVLGAKDSVKFIKSIQVNLKKPVKATPTPKAAQAIKTIMANAARKQK
ncbi:MAG: hypothetical protein U9O82_03405 [Thermodesulfobacteriota bacterium]|nr:hypothetical protein [Thermodesulfobacteriota bacterium]